MYADSFIGYIEDTHFWDLFYSLSAGRSYLSLCASLVTVAELIALTAQPTSQKGTKVQISNLNCYYRISATPACHAGTVRDCKQPYPTVPTIVHSNSTSTLSLYNMGLGFCSNIQHLGQLVDLGSYI
jgi:hypothetical protein